MDWSRAMSNQVYANMMEVSCKSGSGKTICAFPDVCFTPPQTPVTPPGVPIPYPNTGLASDTTDGSSTVKISGKEVMLKNKSCFKKSSGDEAGCAPKKGVLTSKNTGKVYFNAWSMDVKIEGENVVRHLDITTHNHASQPGNSPPMPHMDAMQPAPPSGSSCPVGSSCNVGSPVNPALGAKVLAGDEDLDFTLPGPLPLAWQRFYLSTNADIGWFGRGWSSPLESRLEALPDPSGSQVEHIEYVDLFGRRIIFDSLKPGASHFSPNDKLTLSRTAQGQYRLAGPDGLTRWFTDRRETVYRLAAITDRNGNTLYLDYRDTTTDVVHVECSGRQRLELAFQDGRLVAITELRAAEGAMQRVLLMRYHFTGHGDLCQVFNRANECVRSFDYTADRLMRKHVYAGAFEAEYEYARSATDARVVRHWDNVGRSWTFAYGADHTAVTDQDGRTVLHHFDGNKRLIGITDALGQVARVGLDRHGNVRALIDPAEHVTETLFDERGNPIEVHEPDGAVTTLEWHPELPLLVAVTDPLMRTTVFRYDARGNLVADVDPAGAETRYEHDERGQVAAVINPNGGVTRRGYNDQGQLTQHVDCTGNVTRYTYDANGWLIAETNALGEQTRFDYDAAGRLIRQTLADGSEESYENDMVGRLTAFFDGARARTEYRYTADGLLAQRTDALGHSVIYRYDRARRLIELINENQALYSFAYDALDRLIEETRFDGTRVRAKYNRASHLIETIEEPGSADEIVFRYARDPLGRLLVRASDRTRAVFEYDGAGQRIVGRTDNPPVLVQMAYDKAGRRIEECVTAAERSYAIRHTYDALGNRLSTTLPDGAELGTLYYGCGNAHQISLGDEPVTDFERDALHREVSRSQGALTSIRRYDQGGHVRRQRAAPTQAQGGAATQIDRQFQYDLAGRLVLAREPGRQLTYGYDAIDQLMRFNEERFAYDPAHNLVPTNGPTGVVADNRVMASEDKRYRYDAHGRVVEKRTGADAVIHLTWNDDHHLVESTIVDGRGSHSTQYLYDAFGRRIAKRSAQGTSWFVWDRDRLLQEYRGVDEYTFMYEPDTFVPLAQAVAKREASVPGARQLYYFHCDQVGVPRELTDAHGRLAWEGDYRGWGRLKNERLDDPSVPHSALRFQGAYFDEENGLHYSLMRYYDPDIARFISKDPIGLLGGVNEYQYAPNPVFWIDPWGLTGTYIFTDGTTSYVGKGPKERFQASKAQRLGSTCGATAEVHKDFGGDDMGFMVEHLLMEHYSASASTSFANAPNLNSPGKKKYEAADAVTKKKARAKRDAMIKDFEAKKAACP
jgi:RHS repeat-associated protein